MPPQARDKLLPHFRVLVAAVTISTASAFYSGPSALSKQPPLSRSPHRALSSQTSALLRTALPKRSFLLDFQHCKPVAEDDAETNSSRGVESKPPPSEGQQQAAEASIANTTSLERPEQTAQTVKTPQTALVLYGILGAFNCVFLLAAPAVEVALVVDYFGVVMPLCGIIIASEKLAWAVMWSAGCLFMGSPFCSAYIFMRLFRYKSLRLRLSEEGELLAFRAAVTTTPSAPATSTTAANMTENEEVKLATKNSAGPKTKRRVLQLIFYAFLCVFSFFFFGISSQNSVEIALIVDYYGAVLPFAAIIAHSESRRIFAFLWAVAAIFFGSPVCCAYVMMRLYKHRTLRAWQEDLQPAAA